MQVLFGYLVLHYNCIWHELDDGSCDPLEIILVFGLVMTGMPPVFCAILARFNYDDHLFLHCFDIIKRLYFIL